MIELVIPTLYKEPALSKLKEQLPLYLKYDLVSAVHIMDNGQEFDEHFPFYRDLEPKLHIHTPEVYNEWYINQAWNKGVEACKDQSIIGILNDDVVFPTDIFEFIAYHSEHMGILGMHDTNYKCETKAYELVDIPQHCMGWGCAFFFDKWNWLPIPKEIKLYFGDTWQFHSNNVPCKALKGVPMKDSNISATLSNHHLIEEFDKQYKEDYSHFTKLTQQENLNLGYVKQDV